MPCSKTIRDMGCLVICLSLLPSVICSICVAWMSGLMVEIVTGITWHVKWAPHSALQGRMMVIRSSFWHIVRCEERLFSEAPVPHLLNNTEGEKSCSEQEKIYVKISDQWWFPTCGICFYSVGNLNVFKLKIIVGNVCKIYLEHTHAKKGNLVSSLHNIYIYSGFQVRKRLLFLKFF